MVAALSSKRCWGGRRRMSRNETTREFGLSQALTGQPRTQVGESRFRSRSRLSLGVGWIQPVEEVEEEEEGEEIEEAGFWAGGAAGEPGGTGDNGFREVAGEEIAAVRDGIEEGFAEVEGGVHADSEP